MQTGQAAARFACSLAFGAAWTAWGDHPALRLGRRALAVSVAVTVWLRPAERRDPSYRPIQANTLRKARMTIPQPADRPGRRVAVLAAVAAASVLHAADRAAAGTTPRQAARR